MSATAVQGKAMPAAENKMIAGAPNKTRCEICGGEIFMKIMHYGGFTPEQLAAHTVASPALAERSACPESEEEAAARGRFYQAKGAADAAVAAVVEAQREPLPGGLRESHGFFEEQARDPRAERTHNARLEGAEASLREALEAQVKADATWRALHDARLRRTAEWRDQQAAAARETAVTREKVSFASRIRRLIRA